MACYSHAEMSKLSARISMHVPEYSLKLSRPFAHHSAGLSAIVVGNQIAEYLRYAATELRMWRRTYHPVLSACGNFVFKWSLRLNGRGDVTHDLLPQPYRPISRVSARHSEI